MLGVDNFLRDKVTPLHTSVLNAIMLESPASLKITVPKLESVELTKEHFSMIDRVIKMFGNKKGCRNSSILAPIVRACYNYEKKPQVMKKIERFIGILNGSVYGISDSEIAAHKLREWFLVSMSSKNSRPLKRVIYRKTENALWMFIQGKMCDKLTEVRKENFPLEMTKKLMPYFDNTKDFEKKHNGKRLTLRD
jgi:hypothetical protein